MEGKGELKITRMSVFLSSYLIYPLSDKKDVGSLVNTSGSLQQNMEGIKMFLNT